MAKISLNYGTKNAIEKETITDGAVYLSTDTDELFVDLSGLRHIIGGGPAWTEMEQPPSYTVPTINTTDSSVDLDQATGTYTAKLNFSNVAGEPYSVSQMDTVNAGKVTVNNQAVNAVQSVTKTDNAVNVVFNAGEVTPTESGTATLTVASGFKVNDDTMTDQAISFDVPCEKYDPVPTPPENPRNLKFIFKNKSQGSSDPFDNYKYFNYDLWMFIDNKQLKLTAFREKDNDMARYIFEGDSRILSHLEMLHHETSKTYSAEGTQTYPDGSFPIASMQLRGGTHSSYGKVLYLDVYEDSNAGWQGRNVTFEFRDLSRSDPKCIVNGNSDTFTPPLTIEAETVDSILAPGSSIQ